MYIYIYIYIYYQLLLINILHDDGLTTENFMADNQIQTYKYIIHRILLNIYDSFLNWKNSCLLLLYFVIFASVARVCVY